MYTKSEIFEQLCAMGAPRDGIVIMHTSLRSVGDVEGGGVGLLDAMIEYFTAEGGLFCVPTHTWANLGKDKITLDFINPESNLGTFSVLAARDGRGVRSENPTHSMVVFGDSERAAKFIFDDVNAKTPTSPETCYGKIINGGGKVLLVGVSQNKNTLLHCVAEMLDLPNRMGSEEIPVTVRRNTGEIVERKIFLYDTDYTSDISWRFPQYDTAFRYHGYIRDGFVGDAPAQLCDAVGMRDTVELIWKNSGGADPLDDEHPIPPAWYVRPRAK